MDQTQRIKVFKWNDDFEELECTKTLKILNSNPALIEKSIFDDFVISKKVLHCKDYMFFMFDSRTNACETFF